MDPGGSLQPAFEVSFNENLLAWTQAVMYWQLEEWVDLAPVSFSWPYWVQLFLQSRKWNMGTSRMSLTRGSFSFTFHKTSCFIFLCLYGSQCPEVAPFQLDLPEAKVAVLECFQSMGCLGTEKRVCWESLTSDQLSCDSRSIWWLADLQVSATVSAEPNADGTVDIELVTETFFAFLPGYNRRWSSVFSHITGQCGCHQS